MKTTFSFLLLLACIPAFAQTKPDAKVDSSLPEENSKDRFEILLDKSVEYLSDLKKDGQKLADDLKKAWEDYCRETAEKVEAEESSGDTPETDPAPDTKEKKLKSVLYKNPKTVFFIDRDGRYISAEVPAGILFTTEDEISYFFDKFDGKEIVLTGTVQKKTFNSVTTQTGVEISFRADQYLQTSFLQKADYFSVYGILLPPSDFYPHARILDAVFVMF